MNITVKSSIMPLSLKGHHIMTFENSETAKNPFAHTIFQNLQFPCVIRPSNNS